MNKESGPIGLGQRVPIDIFNIAQVTPELLQVVPPASSNKQLRCFSGGYPGAPEMCILTDIDGSRLSGGTFPISREVASELVGNKAIEPVSAKKIKDRTPGSYIG